MQKYTKFKRNPLILHNMDSTEIKGNGKRIARNTLLLYGRMLFLLVVGLYTSRVVLAALGFDDSGIYNAVGGVVASFAVISGALSAAISRFLTFELGKRDGLSDSPSGATGKDGSLSDVFSSSVMIMAVIAAAIVILAEAFGPWFIKAKMTIPDGRMTAAMWVFQFSLATFVINLISVPYNAAIIAHERMKAFAYIGIFEGLGKLAVALLLLTAKSDRLIFYAALMCAVAVCVRLAYSIYCRRFDECRVRPRFDWPLMKKMFSFAGWNFIGASSAVLRDQGGSILINIFSGPAVNAARALAVQLSGAVQSFVTNFMTATNPQITKSYASGERDYMMKLIYKSAKFSFFLLLVIAVPVIFNIDFVLDLWLKDVPGHTNLFVILALLYAMSESVSTPLIVAMLATGDIKKYQIIVGGIQLLNIPVAWLFLHFGFPPEVVPAVALVLSQCCLAARLVLLRRMIGLEAGRFIREVYLRTLLTAVIAAAVPAALYFSNTCRNGWGWFIINGTVCLVWTAATIWFSGLSKGEKTFIINKLHHRDTD